MSTTLQAQKIAGHDNATNGTPPFCNRCKVSQFIKTMRIYTENPDNTRFWSNNLFFSFYYVIFSCRNFGLQTFFLYLQISWEP